MNTLYILTYQLIASYGDSILPNSYLITLTAAAVDDDDGAYMSRNDG